jgi:integrase
MTNHDDGNPEKRTKPVRARGTGSIFVPKGSSFYWIAWISGGKRHYESTKSTRKGDAQELLSAKLGDTAHGHIVTPKIGKITLGAGLKLVTDNLTMNGRQSAHDTRRRIDLHLLKHFNADRRMNTVTTADVERYKAERLEEKAKPATINRELATLRRAFRLAVRGGELPSMPYVGLLEENNVRTGFFERTEFDAILKELPADLRAPVQFAYITGWRFKSEVLSLTIGQVDLSAGFVRLEPGTTKSGEGRAFYVTAELRNLLEQQLASIKRLMKRGVICPYVFHRSDGSRIKNMRSAWEGAREAAGHPNKLFHDFRRTAVRNLERAGVPRSTAMAMVGHETEAIYNRYAIVDEAMHREGAAKLDAWANQQKAKAKANAKRTGQLQRFERRQAVRG